MLIAKNDLKKYIAVVDSINRQKKERPGKSYIPDIWPVQGIISRNFSNDHPGLDIVAKMNQLVMAAARGIVSESEWHRDFGNYVLITHHGHLKTLYAHLNRASVKIGDYVKKGDAIGTLGNTGNSSGPHLHYEIIQNNKNINPVKLLLK